MSKIRILPEILSNKIAAGEVVERPASVVKELVENAIDAHSRRILIEIQKGGRALIRVSDNGRGMGHDDALLALERYATSKIYKDEDLFSINTMGFRGEALPSIASVSKFSLVTSRKDADVGVEVIVAGGKIRNVSEVGAPTGTMVCVEQLFFNMPARRKFLKSINTEMGHIADTVASIALGWPEIQFKLLHNGKIVKNWPKVSNQLDRILDVLGHHTPSDFHEIGSESPNGKISGWIALPKLTRSSSKKIHIYVNGRYIRDRGIQHAIFEGYGGRLVKGQFPVAVLFINLPFNELDVNVHPTKHEVRFEKQKEVYEAVKNAVSAVWNTADQPKGGSKKQPEPTGGQKVKNVESAGVPEKILESTTVFRFRDGKRMPEKPDVTKQPIMFKPSGEITQNHGRNLVADPPAEFSKQENIIPFKKQDNGGENRTGHSQTTLWKSYRFSDLTVIGQFHNTYILCGGADELILVDQHAAHERILFEQLKKKSQSTSGAAQRLLLPETMDLGYSESVLLEKMIPGLHNLGLEIEPFGGNTFVIKTVPAILSDREVKPLILEVLDRMEEIGFVPDPENPGFEKAIDECLILMACHGAIRANQALTQKEMTGLLHQLDQCDRASHCPHGRPTWVNWTLKDLEKSFKRIV